MRDVFIKNSPFEWSFPFQDWLDQLRSQTGHGPSQLAAFETYRIAHTLKEIVRGYLCGSNDKRWSNRIFSYNRIAKQPTVRTYFYRFEFQNRGTLHVHLLIWLKDITKAQHHLIRADISPTDPQLAYLAYKLQKSDKHLPNLNLQNEDSFFETRNSKQVHHLKHPAAEFALNLRACVLTHLLTLKCPMDYQTTDGVGMLLRYVSSHVTKFRDNTPIDSLYLYKFQGRQAAIRYLISNQPAKPEMCFFCIRKKLHGQAVERREYTVPTNETLPRCWQRPQELEKLMFLQWLRHVDHTKLNPKSCKDGSTLAEPKIHSIFNQQYFFSTRCCISAIETLLKFTILITTMFQNNCSVLHKNYPTFPTSVVTKNASPPFSLCKATRQRM